MGLMSQNDKMEIFPNLNRQGEMRVKMKDKQARRPERASKANQQALPNRRKALAALKKSRMAKMAIS